MQSSLHARLRNDYEPYAIDPEVQDKVCPLSFWLLFSKMKRMERGSFPALLASSLQLLIHDSRFGSLLQDTWRPHRTITLLQSAACNNFRSSFWWEIIPQPNECFPASAIAYTDVKWMVPQADSRFYILISCNPITLGIQPIPGNLMWSCSKAGSLGLRFGIIMKAKVSFGCLAQVFPRLELWAWAQS